MQNTRFSPSELNEILVEYFGLTEKNIDSFVSPEYHFGDFFLFKDMEKAVGRLYRAIKNNENIGIYGDYDCDGIPAVVILVDLFKKIGNIENIHIYIPDRHDEGYGLSQRGIDELFKKGVSLMITVDLGITAIDHVKNAQEKGIDVILTDHHEPLNTGFPEAYCVIHPRNGTYPNQDPCGAGVAFYFISAFLEKYRGEFDIQIGWEKWLLDLVGFATLADMVPLVGENRMLAKYGLVVMNQTKRLGLKTLFLKNNINLNYLTENDLTFTLAPRLNAASRMDTPMLAFELLSTNDETVALTIVKKLDQINNERKLLVARIVKSAHINLDNRELPEIVVVGNPDWRPAVLGLVANKLQEFYNKSFFVWGEGGDGSIKGSCRMVSRHHAALLFQALPKDFMLHAGGHKAAGGFSITKEKIHFLENALNSSISNVSHIEESLEEKTIILSLGSVTIKNLEVIRKFAPFGVENLEPIFLFKNVEVQNIKMFGKNKEHLECIMREGSYSVIAFNFFTSKDLLSKLSIGSIVSFTGVFESGYRGGVRIRIKEVL